MNIHTTIESLYDRDHYLWIETTIEQIRRQRFESVEWDKVIEELESVGRSDKRAIESLLTRMFEHWLKLLYWQSEREYNARKWRAEIRNFRKQLKRELKASPGLKSYFIEVLPECYQDAREILADLSGLKIETFPQDPIATPEQILDENWLTD
jgi:Domain of unknown function DUF29